MTTQEKNKAIAEWLGLRKLLSEHFDDGTFYFLKREPHAVRLNFHKDRNQQKLIEDKLIKMGYNLKYLCMSKEHKFTIYKGIEPYSAFGKSKDIAFIDAVIELIKSK